MVVSVPYTKFMDRTKFIEMLLSAVLDSLVGEHIICISRIMMKLDGHIRVG